MRTGPRSAFWSNSVNPGSFLKTVRWQKSGTDATFSAYYQRGDAYLQLKHYEQAITDFGKAIEFEPNNTITYIKKSFAHLQLEQYVEAIDCCNKALELDTTLATAYHDRGIAKSRLEQNEQAIEDFTRAIQFRGDDAKTYRLRGMVYSKLGKYTEAITDYTFALNIEPNDTNTLFLRGFLNQQLGQYHEAIEDYVQITKLHPDDDILWTMCAELYLKIGNIKQAEILYQRLINRHATVIYMLWKRQWCGLGIKRGGVEVAEQLEKIAATSPDNYYSKVCAGVALGYRDKPLRGLRVLKEATLLEPEEADAYFWQGVMLAYLDRGEEALDVLNKAVELELPPVLLFPLHWLEHDRPQLYSDLIRPWLDLVENKEQDSRTE